MAIVGGPVLGGRGLRAVLRPLQAFEVRSSSESPSAVGGTVTGGFAEATAACSWRANVRWALLPSGLVSVKGFGVPMMPY